MKILTALLMAVSCFAQCQDVPSTIAPNVQSQFNLIHATTCSNVAPNNGTTGNGAMGVSFPTVSGVAAVGYQGGMYLSGIGPFWIPWQANDSIPHGTIIANTGASFTCSGQADCQAKYSWFDMTTLNANNKGLTCQALLDNNGIVTMMPGADNQAGNFVAFNSLGSSAMTTGGGGVTSVFTNSANYKSVAPPAKGGAWGSQYGWCGGAFDAAHGMEYFVPTKGGVSVCNAILVQYNQGGGAFPAQFDISNFTPFDMVNTGGIPNACGYLSIIFDGAKYLYLIPTQGAAMVQYDTTQSFTSAGSYRSMMLPSLGTAGHPSVTGNGDLGQIQANGYYVGGQMVWVGTTEYMYMFPFATCPDCTSAANKTLVSNVIRAVVATCSTSAQVAQSCSGTFTAVNALASGQTWEIFDLGNLAVNNMSPAPNYTATNTFAGAGMSDALGIGGFQYGWLNTHNTADPIVGMIADFGNYYVRHHAAQSLSTFSSWDVYPMPLAQRAGCEGGGYDPVSQSLFTSCATKFIFKIGPI